MNTATCSRPGCPHPALADLLTDDGITGFCLYCYIQFVLDAARVGTRIISTVQPVMAVA